MRFLNTETGEFVERPPETTRYAILSHTWNEEGEQTFTGLRKIQTRYNLKALCSRRGAASGSGPQPAPASPPAAQSDASEHGSLTQHPFHASVDTTHALSPVTHPDGKASTRLAEGEGSVENGSATSSGGSRLSRPLHQLLHFVRLLFLLPASLLSSPSQDLPELPSPNISSQTPGLVVNPIQDPPLSARGSQSSMTRCCIWHDPDLSSKVREACRVAREAGYDYLWIDSSCIDKSSSSELSEAINSMYEWYGRSTLCYAYLADVPSDEDPRAKNSAFRKSRWYKRGWTLQELVAPRRVTFLSTDWVFIGTKHMLVDVIEDITGIADEALLHLKSLDEFSVAQRLSWAAQRETTRVEDHAYSLLGIFDINMTTLYGEGLRSFRRLQEEIMRRVPDQSIFAWGRVWMIPENSRYLVHHLSLQANAVDDMLESMIAPNLSFLSNACGVRAVPHAEVYRRLQLPQLPAAQYIPTPHGIQMQIPVISLPHCFADTAVWYTEEIPQPQWYLAILGCEHSELPGALLGRVCYIPPSDSGVEYLYCKNLDIHHRDYSLLSGFSLVPLSPTIIARCRGSILLKTVYISLPALTGRPSHSFNEDFNETINLILRKKTCDALRTEGYTAELQSPDPSHATTHCLTLSRLRESYKITIEYQHTFAPITHELRIKAYASLSWPVDHSVEEIEAVPSFAEWQSFVAPWQWTSSTEKLAFFLGTSKITVELGFHYAGQSHYFLHVVIDRSRELSEDERREPWETWQPGPDFRPSPPPSPIVRIVHDDLCSPPKFEMLNRTQIHDVKREGNLSKIVDGESG